MAHILRKTGWVLNPDDALVNRVLNIVEYFGNCSESPDKGVLTEEQHCPCVHYRENDICYSGLYLKIQK